MNGYLVDTHVLLWWLADPDRLAEPARRIIGDGNCAVFLSAAAAWEMGIKKALGRLEFPTNLAEVLRQEDIGTLDITLAHALAVADLPLHHQDPFDRMQIVQARMEELTIISRDPEFGRYDVRSLEA